VTTLETLAAEVRSARAEYEATRAARERGEASAGQSLAALQRLDAASERLVFHAGGLDVGQAPVVNVACRGVMGAA